MKLKMKRTLSCLLTVLLLLTMLSVSAFAVEGEVDLKTTLGITNNDITVTAISKGNEAELSEAAQDRSWGIYSSNEIISGGFMGGRIYSACHIESAGSTSQYVTITMDVPTLKEEDKTQAHGWVVLALVDGELVTYPTEEVGDNQLKFNARLGKDGTDIALSYLTNMSNLNPVGDWGTLTLEPGDVINHSSLGYVREYTLTYKVSENIATYLQYALPGLPALPFDLTFYLNSTGLKIDAETISFGENDLFELNPDETEKVDDGCYKFTVNVDTEAWKNGRFSNAVGISYAAPNASSLLFEGEMRSFTMGSIVPNASMMGCVPLPLTVVEPPDDETTYHKIIVAQTDGGKIEPRGVEGEVWVKDGEDQAFTITPDTGYEIVDVLVDNQSVGAISSYTFAKVSDDSHTISATFQRSGTVTITPADITVYTGGEGYTGVVDNAGSQTTTANGLPEPGFYITLPDWMNDKLGGDANAVDLSDSLTITYENGTSTRTWELELYGTEEHSTTVADQTRARYIYRILPGKDETGKEIPIRMQLKDGNTVITSDKFTPSLTEQYKEYDMSIFSGELDASKITAQLVINGQTVTCAVESATGKLVVRGLTGEDTTTDIGDSESKVSGSNITAVAPADVTYYVNGSKVEVSDTGGVKLLVDDVLSDGVLAEYIEENITSIPAGNYTYEEKYLDLVDTKNGNAYLTLDEGQKMTMYWPVPSNMNTSKNYYIVHFEALDRNYNNMNQELETTPPTTVAGTSLVTVNGKQYIKFETDSFSPFVLVYEKTTGGGGGGGGTTRYTITAEAGDGGSISPSGRVSVTAGANRTFTITADDGYEIADVIVDDESVGAVSSYTFKNVRANHTIKVIFKEEAGVADPDDTGVSSWLNTDDHTAYLSGYPNDLFGANKNMTRAEVAQMLYNLLLDKDVAITVAFDDVAADAWYADAVNTLASLGMIEGVGNNLFEPERSITRAEFTTIAMRFTNGILEGENIFPDVNPGDWFYDYVVGSIQYGWINGYPDGTFGPNNTITRAEVTAIVNRMLGRSADEDYVDSHTTDLRQFTDLADTHWAYYDIMEATNTHDYSKSGSAETWRGLHN